MRRCAERIGDRGAARERKGGDDRAVDLRHDMPSGCHRQALQSRDPLERIVVVHRAEPQHDRLGLRRPLLGHLAAREPVPNLLLELPLPLVDPHLVKIRMHFRLLPQLHNLC